MHAKLNSFGAPSLLLLVVLCYQNVGGSPADAAPPNDLVVEVCHGHVQPTSDTCCTDGLSTRHMAVASPGVQ